MNVNMFEDSQVMQIDLMEEPIGEYETHTEESTKEPFLVGDDHIKQHQIYSNKKELQKKVVYDCFEKKVPIQISKIFN